VGLEEYNNHLHDKVMLAKGDKPLIRLNVYRKLNVAWKFLGSWNTIPLGKGFYEVLFTSLEDMRHEIFV